MRTAIALAAVLASAAIGCEAGGDTETASFDAGVKPADRPKPEPPPTPEPDGTYELNCDYLLGDFGTEGTEQGDRFVAGGDVTNSGNIGAILEVKAEWEILGSEPVIETRRVRLRPGQTKNVQMTAIAVGEQISAHQSADSRCEADATIIDTFGRAR